MTIRMEKKKNFILLLIKRLIELREDRSTLIEFIIKYLFDTNSDSLSKISDFLKKQMQ